MKKSIIGIVAIALIAAMMVITPTAAFEPGECDIYVYSGQSIDAAVDSATDGQTVCVYNGTYGGRIDFEGDPRITLKGEGADVVTWDGGSEDKIVIGDNDAATSGCILEGFTIKGAEAGTDLVKPLAPDCIIRNCVFEGLGGSYGVQLAADNTTFENNVIEESTSSYGILNPTGTNITIVNNTIINNPAPAVTILMWGIPNCIFARNNISSNGEAMGFYQPGNPKMYLNNFINNDVTLKREWDWTGEFTGYWNSTEPITYTYDSNTYTNYMGNYWGSDYTGTDADGDGIGDTPYEVPDSLGNDYRPLMEGYANYPEVEAGPEPTNEVYFEPSDISANYCETTVVGVWANTSVQKLTSGKVTFDYTFCCANATAFYPNSTNWENWCAGNSLTPGKVILTFATLGAGHSGDGTPVHIGDLAMRCCNESSDCVTGLVWDTNTDNSYLESGSEDITPVEWHDGTLNCTAPTEKPDLNVTEKYEEWVSMVDKTYNVTYTVKNVGAAEAGASKTCIYIDGVNVLNDSVGALTAGADYMNTVGPFTMSGVSDTIKVCADNDNEVDESDEANNCMENELVYPGMPDLNVTEKYETLDDGNFTVTYTVANIGAAGAGASNTTIYVDGTPVMEDAVPALAGENYTNTVGPFTMSGNSDTIKVCADNGNVIAESDETNNCMENVLVQDKVNVTIGCAITAPGGMVSVPITMLGIQDYGAGTINVEYDSSVVTCEGVFSSPQSTLAAPPNIDNTDGIVNISAMNTGGVSGDVIFATVTFKAVGSNGECSPLNIIVDYLGNIGSITLPFYTTNCSICIADDVPPVTEYPTASPPRILNDNGRARVPGTDVSQLSVIVSDPSGVNSVTVNLTPIRGAGFENVPMSLSSGNVYSGVWSASTNAATGVNLTHSLLLNATDDFGNSNTALIPLTVLRRGDVVRNNRVDMGDALYIARYTVGLESSAPDEFVAGVVPASSWDGVNMGDALYIARYTVGLETAP